VANVALIYSEDTLLNGINVGATVLATGADYQW